MTVYTYKARVADGRGTTGTVTADTPATARRVLRERGLTLLEFEPSRVRPRHALGVLKRTARRQEQVAEVARQLALLLQTGVPIAEALTVLIRQLRGPLAVVMKNVHERVCAGSCLHEALEAHPDWFDEMFCSSVRVGQLSGQMDASLRDLAAFLRRRQTMRASVLTAMAYPAILAVLGVGVVIFLMAYVAPQLLDVLESSGRALPLPTAVLKSVSDNLVAHWVAIVAVGALLTAGITAFYRWETGRRLVHAAQLRIPIVGDLIRKSLVAQFSQMMSLLLASGVPFLDALRLAHRNARHLVLRGELALMATAVERGRSLADAVEHSRVFPPLVAHVMNVGQRSGELTQMLAHLREGYETEVQLALGRFTAALEPALILVMAGVVGFIVLATMMPILDATRLIL